MKAATFLSALISLTFGLALFPTLAVSEPRAICAVPVCDMERALVEFETGTQHERYLKLRELIQIANYSRDAKVLLNLLEFGRRSRDALYRVKDDNWVHEMAINLAGTSIVNLAKYAPLTGEGGGNLEAYFEQIILEPQRLDVLQFWKAKLSDVESQEELLILSKFFARAAVVAYEREDDDQVILAAKGAEQLVYGKLFRLYPSHEGVFKVVATCAKGREDCGAKLIDRMIVLDTFTQAGIQISFVNSEMSITLNSFINVGVSHGATVLEADSRNAGIGPLARLKLDFDVATRMYRGTLTTPDATMEIVAEPTESEAPIQLFEKMRANPNPHPIPQFFFEETMEGTFGKHKVTLRVTVFGEEQIGGTFTFVDLPSSKIRFHAGRFFPKTGILVLVGNHPSGGLVKMTLAIQKVRDVNYALVTGTLFFASNGAENPIYLGGTLFPPAPIE